MVTFLQFLFLDRGCSSCQGHLMSATALAASKHSVSFRRWTGGKAESFPLVSLGQIPDEFISQQDQDAM